jgi:hypothetical protein
VCSNTDLRKFVLCKFSSAFLVFQCGASGQSILTSGQTGDPDGSLLESGQDLTESGRALSSSSERSLYIVRMRATSLLLSEPASVWTSSIHRLEGDSTEAIKTPARRILPHTPQNLNFWLLVSYLSLSSLAFCIFPIFQVLFFSFFFLSFFLLLECYLFFEYEMHISAMLKFLGLSCDIILNLFFFTSPFTAVILPNLCYPNKNIFGILFFGQFLLDLLQNHVCRQSTPQGPSEACRR